ncbi:MAG: hypothetical protein PCFJNLEI_01059 [Verrucomicrobiae bacterium]|nr:hypothetical protein [Verrucomicrobiae bacterium]
MKPTTTMKKQRTTNLPGTPKRVPVVFLPQQGWQVDIGRTPVKTFATAQTVRDNSSLTGYKRAHGSSQLTHVFVPVGLLDDAAKQRATSRHSECRAELKPPVNL